MDDQLGLSDMIISEPCPMDWERMTGNDRARYCHVCGRHVYDLTAMRQADAEALLRAHRGELCGRAYQRPDGTLTLTASQAQAAKSPFQFTIRALMAVIAGVAATLGFARLFAPLGTTSATASTQRRQSIVVRQDGAPAFLRNANFGVGVLANRVQRRAGLASALTANGLRRMVCTHATVSVPVARPATVSLRFSIHRSAGCTARARGMEPLTIDRTHILVLNYNGRDLLADCLPSIVAAALRAPVPCRVTVVDNGSTDDSRSLVASRWPAVGFVRETNLGLASFNRVLARLDEPVVLLLNNDVKLDAGAVGPLLEVFETPRRRPLLGTAVLDVRRPDLRRDADAGAHAVWAGAGDVPGSGLRAGDRRARPDGRGRAGSGRRSPPVPGARGLRPDLLPGPDRGPRPGLPRLDGRLSRLLRARVGRLPPGLRHVRAAVGPIAAATSWPAATP